MKTETEIIALVYELNDRTLDAGHTGKMVFETSGFCSSVTLFGEVVWDDQDFGAPWDEEKDAQMPLRDWFMRRIQEIKTEIIMDCEMMLQSEGLKQKGDA